KRSVASAHLALHEAHCLLFLVLCPECKEAVPQEKMDEHCRGGHQQVGCAMCQQSLPKHSLEVHEQGELHEHHCGRRTKLCPGCGQLFMLHVLAKHRDVCRGEQARLQEGERIPAPESNICCDYCNQMIPGNKYFDHLSPTAPALQGASLTSPAFPDRL
ncbi:XIAP-associated factor 1, partial [Camelus dromedarius]